MEQTDAQNGVGSLGELRPHRSRNVRAHVRLHGCDDAGSSDNNAGEKTLDLLVYVYMNARMRGVSQNELCTGEQAYKKSLINTRSTKAATGKSKKVAGNLGKYNASFIRHGGSDRWHIYTMLKQ